MHQCLSPRTLAQFFYSAHNYFGMTAKQDINLLEALYSFRDSTLTLSHNLHIQRNNPQSRSPCLLVLLRSHFFQEVFEIR